MPGMQWALLLSLGGAWASAAIGVVADAASCSFASAAAHAADSVCGAGEGCVDGGCGTGSGTGSQQFHRTLYYTEQVPRVITRPELLTYIEGEYAFGVVADLDLMSRDPQDFIWRSYLKKGRVLRVNGRMERDHFTIAWDEELVLTSSTATRNRSMELSELVFYNRRLIAFCDYSGIAYKIDPHTGKTIQRLSIADGNGDESKPFKGEWATVKGDTIWLGSIGFEWYGPDGEVMHRNAEWVKLIDAKGGIRNLDWHPVYQTIRSATNTTLPGFLWHEAIEWEPLDRIWVMLPRFASTTSQYTPGIEHRSTADMLIVADESFLSIKVVRLQHHDPRFGFTSLRRLPGSHQLFMALRVHEDGDKHLTQAAIIDLAGNFYTEPPYIEVGTRKYEGLAFL